MRRSSDDRKKTNSKANDLQESLQSEIEKDKKELAKVNHKIVQNNNLKLPLSEDALSALRKVYDLRLTSLINKYMSENDKLFFVEYNNGVKNFLKEGKSIFKF